MKTFQEYQRFTESKAVYNDMVFYHVDGMLHHAPWTYPVHALAEEAGEVNGKIAKFIRKYGTDREELAGVVASELGDVLYQVSEVARQFGLTLDEVVNANVAKLDDREERGVLVGEGDNR